MIPCLEPPAPERRHSERIRPQEWAGCTVEATQTPRSGFPLGRWSRPVLCAIAAPTVALQAELDHTLVNAPNVATVFTLITKRLPPGRSKLPSCSAGLPGSVSGRGTPAEERRLQARAPGHGEGGWRTGWRREQGPSRATAARDNRGNRTPVRSFTKASGRWTKWTLVEVPKNR